MLCSALGALIDVNTLINNILFQTCFSGGVDSLDTAIHLGKVGSRNVHRRGGVDRPIEPTRQPE